MSTTLPAAPSRAAAVSESVAVPALNLSAGFAPLRDEILRELAGICESGQYILGPKVAEFEGALAGYCRAPHALGVSSGTDALLLSMMALEIGPGDEVIVPAFTFFASAGCVARLGATPVFCDIDPRTFNIDVSDAERRITPRTRAVMPVHLYGQLADMPRVMELATRHGLHVVEDAAQAIGARLDGDPRTAGGFGEYGCLSFYPTKNLGAIGDAGAVLSRSAELHERALLLRTHGERPKYHHRRIGGNFRLDALQAAILRIKLAHVEAWTARRRERAERYRRLFAQADLADAGIVLPFETPGALHVYHQFVIRAGRRDALLAHLQERRIGAAVYYPVPLHLQECFADRGHRRGEFPGAESAADEVLALPIYPELSDGQQDAVVEAVAEFHRPK